MVYDVTNRRSFEHIETWLNEINLYSTNTDVVKLLVGNKVDKESMREVTKLEGQEFARSRAMFFIEASAKTTVGIQQTFTELVQKIMDVPELVRDSMNEKKPKLNIEQVDSQDNQAGGFCGC